MEFEKVPLKSGEHEFIFSAYVGPTITRYGIKMRPMITKERYDDGWGTRMFREWPSKIEISSSIRSNSHLFLEIHFYDEKHPTGFNLFSRLADAKRMWRRWDSEITASTIDIIFMRLEESTARRFLDIQWEFYTESMAYSWITAFNGPEISGYRKSKDHYLEWSKIAQTFELSFGDDIAERFVEARPFTPVADYQHDVMEFGDIRVGGNRDSSSGCGCILPLLLLVGSVLATLIILVIP